jgi:hypothetical protein
MNLWPLCAFIWFNNNNIEKMLLQMTSGFLQLESAILISICFIIDRCHKFQIKTPWLLQSFIDNWSHLKQRFLIIIVSKINYSLEFELFGK